MTFTENNLFVIANRDGYYIDDFYGIIYQSEAEAEGEAEKYNIINHNTSDVAEVYSIARYINTRLDNMTYWAGKM